MIKFVEVLFDDFATPEAMTDRQTEIYNRLKAEENEAAQSVPQEETQTATPPSTHAKVKCGAEPEPSQRETEVTQLNAYTTEASEVATDKLDTTAENNNDSSTNATVALPTTKGKEDKILVKEERTADFNDKEPLDNDHDARINTTREEEPEKKETSTDANLNSSVPETSSHSEIAAETNSSSEVNKIKVPVLKRRAKDQPELAEAGREMSNAFSTLNKVLNKKVAIQDDECELYDRLLATKLKKFPENEREEIMLEIDNMIMNRRRNKQNKHNNSYPYTTRPGSSQSSDQSEWSYISPSPHSRPPSADVNRSTYTPYQAPPQRLQMLSDKMVPLQRIKSGPSSNIQAQSEETYNDSLQSQSSQFTNILYEELTLLLAVGYCSTLNKRDVSHLPRVYERGNSLNNFNNVGLDLPEFHEKKPALPFNYDPPNKSSNAYGVPQQPTSQLGPSVPASGLASTTNTQFQPSKSNIYLPPLPAQSPQSYGVPSVSLGAVSTSHTSQTYGAPAKPITSYEPPPSGHFTTTNQHYNPSFSPASISSSYGASSHSSSSHTISFNKPSSSYSKQTHSFSGLSNTQQYDSNGGYVY
ncbi:hypothetical protein FQA39_LY02272 [Lamprigera yunnana]|nr:hypothetical protein FQA39_LY02272 [Lamprigera yunnana]